MLPEAFPDAIPASEIALLPMKSDNETETDGDFCSAPLLSRVFAKVFLLIETITLSSGKNE